MLISQCNAIHKTIVEQFKHAIVYGQSVKHQPQRVGLSHELADEDISKRPYDSPARIILTVCSHNHKTMMITNDTFRRCNLQWRSIVHRSSCDPCCRVNKEGTMNPRGAGQKQTQKSAHPRRMVSTIDDGTNIREDSGPRVPSVPRQ